MPFLRQGVLPGILVLSFTIYPLTAAAQDSAPEIVPAEGPALVRIANTRHPLAIPENAAGRVENGRNLQRMMLVLAPSPAQEEALQKLLDEQQNRNSANYHHWLTATEFGARFGAADADIARVQAWLTGAGLAVGKISASRRWIEFSGTAAQVESAFHTEMHYYRFAGKTYVANATDLAVPAALSGVTRGVLSLNSFGRKPPVRTARGVAGRDAQGHRVLLRPNLTAAGATDTYYLSPGDFAAIYNTKGLLSSGVNGSGITIVVVAQSQIELTDVQQFQRIFALPASDPNIFVNGPDPGVVSQLDTNEALLDTEWAGAIAPGATIDVVVAGSTDTTSGVDLAAAFAIDNQIAPILTYTYGSCEQVLGTTGNAFYNALWQQAAAEGITVLVAAGDNGAAGCDNPTSGNPAALGPAVNGAASTPYNVAVGGTEFAEGTQAATYWSGTNAADYSSALGYIPEKAWNESCDPGQAASETNCTLGSGNLALLSGGGGASTVYSKPGWQGGSGVPADGARDVPDVALAAASGHDEFVYCTSLAGTPCQINAQQEVVGLTLVGGTSAATPAMAGILALVEQKNGAYQGQVNYVLYRLAEMTGNSCDSSQQTNPAAQNSCVFYDITSGSNAVPCLGGSPGCSSSSSGTNGFLQGGTAAAGYDLATGLGSLSATNLAAAWKNAMLAGSQISLQASSASLVHGAPLSVNGTVAAASGTGMPTGMVSIKTDAAGDSAQMLAVGSAGTFSGTVSDLPGGQYNIFAHYAGDATYAASDSSVLPLIVTPENGVTTLTVDGLQNGNASYGSPLQLKAKVAGDSGNGVATGSVTIQDSGSVMGTYALGADGGAFVRTGGNGGASLTPGTHSLTATYAGDSSFNASTSGVVAFTIGKGTPFVVVGVNAATIAEGQTLGARALVSGPGSSPATGTVQFTVDGTACGSPVTLQTGGFFGAQAQASLLINNLAQGPHTIGASYDGSADPNYASVTSGDPANELTQTVMVGASSGTKSTTTLIVSAAPANLGDTGSFTVTVSPASATGTVTLWDASGPRSAATAIVPGAQGAQTSMTTIQFAWTQAGGASVYAVYSGDGTNAPSASNATSFQVQKGVPRVIVAAPGNATPLQQVSVNGGVVGNPANLQLPFPTGVAELWDSANGGPPQMLTVQNLTAGPGNITITGVRLKLAAGTHSLHWHYRGDANWLAADSAAVPLDSSTFTLGVTPATIPVPAGNTGSGTVTITPGGGFSGTVALACPTGGTILPAGYACSFGQTNVPVSGSAVTTSINLTPISTPTSVVKVARASGNEAIGGMTFAGGLLLFGLAGLGGPRRMCNFVLACGFVLGVVSAGIGCGGGSSGGGGQVSTTTSLVSSDLHVGYGTPVTLTVRVTPNGNATPAGYVQLFDNGQTYGSPTKVSAGIASFLSTNLPVGVHTMTAQYQGDAGTTGSTSPVIAQVIAGTVALQITGTANGITQMVDFQAAVD